MLCEECEDKLFEYDSGELDSQTAAELDAHLDSCSACASHRQDIWELAMMANRWSDIELPGQDIPVTQGASSAHSWLPLLAIAASLFAVALVLSGAHISKPGANGFAVSFGNSGYITPDELERRMKRWNEIRNNELSRQRTFLSEQQQANNQLLASALLQTSRSERREDLSLLVDYWSAAQTKQLRATRDSLNYLVSSQVQDKRDIEQLGEAVKLISFQGGNDY